MAPKDISLSADQRKIFDKLFETADKEELGVLTGDKAVPFFEASQLPGQTLGEIWALADDENTGFLTKEAFYVVCRLIGHCQSGQTVSDNLVKRAGPLPYFKGMSVPGLPQQPPSSAPSTPQKSAGTAAPLGSISISAQDKAKYTRLFYNSQPSNGLLDGEKARDIFMKSRLSNDQLGQIWTLADTQNRGALDATDFVIAMTLIQGSMNGSIPRLPDTLPVSLYAQASSGGPGAPSAMPSSPLRAQMTGGTPQSALYPQQTGGSLASRQGSAISPLGQSQRSFASSQSAGAPWAIDATEKLQSDQFFNMLDTSRQGIIGGDIAVPFFVQSGLPEETLAQIWDLSDIRKEGSLSKDEFAVARHLVMDALAGKPVPDQLEQNMIPPSLRAIAQQVANQPQQSEVQRDLFSLMDDDEPSQLPPAAAASAASAFQTPGLGARTASPAPLQPAHTGSSHRAMSPAVQPTPTGGSSRQNSVRSPPPVPSHRSHVASPAPATVTSNDFFDTTPVEEKADPIPDNSAEIGNLQNQVRETQQSVSSLRKERTALGGKVAQTEGEVDELKSALAQAKAAFDTESTNMTNLETRYNKGSQELKKIRQELISAESDLSALREQKQEMEQNILKDKEEIRGLKIKLSASNDEVASLKETLEKLRKDARQQKGMLVVNKKQLATSEGDKEKITQALATEEAQLHSPPTEEAVGSVGGGYPAASAVPLPVSSAASPAPSAHSGRSMNPFFANTAPARVASPLQAPAVMAAEQNMQNMSSFDDDPFAMAKQPSGNAPSEPRQVQPTASGFDDDFFSSSPSVVGGPTSEEKGKGRAISPAGLPAQSAAPHNTDFDAAFADFDEPLPESRSAQPAAPQFVQPTPVHAATPVDASQLGDGGARGVNDSTAVSNLPGAAAVGATVGALAAAGAAALTGSAGQSEDREQGVISPSSMQPYESRNMPEDQEDDDEGDGELAPIRDVEQPDSDSESDSDSDSNDGDGSPARSGNATGAESAAGPFASQEDDERADNTASSVTEEEEQAEPVHSKASDPFPGAFPSSRSSNPPSSVGEGEENFEDAHTEQQERSASPLREQTVPVAMSSTTGVETTPAAQDVPSAAVPSQPETVHNESAVTSATSLGFDDDFSSPLNASHDSQGVPPAATAASQQTAETSVPATLQSDSSVPSTVVPLQEPKSADRDEFDDFEDLTPAQVEESRGVGAETQAPARAGQSLDFDSNFDDDFGFDNQTFSHNNAGAAQPGQHAQGASGFDDNFDSAFGQPAANNVPPALPARGPTVGFDDDFFASSSSAPAEPTSSSASAQRDTEPSLHVAQPAQSVVPYDVPPPGEPPVQAQAAPLPQQPQQQQQSNLGVSALPTRSDSDGDMPQVKELVGMGFNRKQAIAALEDNQFDLERAANALLAVNN